MSRVLTTETGIEEALKQSTAEVYVYLLKITFDPLDTEDILRFTNNYGDLVGPDGETYSAKGFTLTQPSDSAERPSSARLSIEDFDRAITLKARNFEEPPIAEVTLVRSGTAGLAEGMITMLIRNVSLDNTGVMSADLVWDSFIQEPYPIRKYDPSLFPGLFR